MLRSSLLHSVIAEGLVVIFRSDLIICLFSSIGLVLSRPKLAIFRPLMIAGTLPLGLTKGFALGPYQGAFLPLGTHFAG